MAGYSGTPIQQKLGIKEGTRLATLNAPGDFRELLGELPLAVEWANRVRPPLDLVVAFFSERRAIPTAWPALTKAVVADGAIWVAWPKKASGIVTDVNEDVMREELLPTGWVDNKVCAIDDVWTGLRFVLRKELRPAKPKATRAPTKLTAGARAARRR